MDLIYLPESDQVRVVSLESLKFLDTFPPGVLVLFHVFAGHIYILVI